MKLDLTSDHIHTSMIVEASAGTGKTYAVAAHGMPTLWPSHPMVVGAFEKAIDLGPSPAVPEPRL